MIAEIKGKVNRKNTNLTQLREDELTGNFFGSMRYIPFTKGMKKVLKKCHTTGRTAKSGRTAKYDR